MNTLIVSEFVDYVSSKKIHFSLTKGFEFAKGLATNKKYKVYYLTLGKTQIIDNVTLINLNEINDEYTKNLKFILLVRETNILEIFEKSPILKKILLDKKDIKIGIKGDSIDWLLSKDYKKNFTKYNLDFITFVINTFDMICVQTEALKKEGLENISKTYNKDICSKIEKKIFISRMGIPNKHPFNLKLENPYDINHNYCADNARGLKEGKALHPLYFISPYLEYSNRKKENYNKQKKIIVYMGRIKTDGGKILLMMKDIMKKLGNEYELHIFPGRFQIPNFEVSTLSPKNGTNIQLLRDLVFYDCDNIIVHYPFDDEEKIKFLQFADYAIDFCPERPLNKPAAAGNAKLLEYCYFGLKVVSEKNIGNSHLVESSKSGILLNGVGAIDDYVNGIKKLEDTKFDREFSINHMYKNHNWDIIANELFDTLSN